MPHSARDDCDDENANAAPRCGGRPPMNHSTYPARVEDVFEFADTAGRCKAGLEEKPYSLCTGRGCGPGMSVRR